MKQEKDGANAKQTGEVNHPFVENEYDDPVIALIRSSKDNEAKDTNAQARTVAFARAVSTGNLIAQTVAFESEAFTIIIGSPSESAKFLCEFNAQVDTTASSHLTFLLTQIDNTIPANTFEAFASYYCAEVVIEGYMGEFEVLVKKAALDELCSLSKVAIQRCRFDLVIDLTKQGVHSANLPPLGYYAVGRQLCSSEDAIEAIQSLYGTFDKPKYFRLDNEKCAHSARGIEGCSRCLEACDTNAITVTAKNVIEINPYLCQGQGTCATVCPTEAIRYDYPDPLSSQDYLSQLLNYYADQGGETPCLVYYSPNQEAALLDHLPALPASCLPVQIEEVLSVGMDTWLHALIKGAGQIIFLTDGIHAKAKTTLKQEIGTVKHLFKAMDIEPERITACDAAKVKKNHKGFAPIRPLEGSEPVTLNKQASKRERFATFLDEIAFRVQASLDITDVAPQSPFGQIKLNTSDCTLCLSCIAVCPTDALKAVGSHPGITFREQDCVQCGMCEKSCPESVITLEPRYNWLTESRQSRGLIHEEPAAECTRCGVPFAPQSMVTMLVERLSNHSHYQEDAIERLSMCEDCRVRDIVEEMIVTHPEKQLKV